VKKSRAGTAFEKEAQEQQKKAAHSIRHNPGKDVRRQKEFSNTESDPKPQRTKPGHQM
jgi:hypothetical protein